MYQNSLLHNDLNSVLTYTPYPLINKLVITHSGGSISTVDHHLFISGRIKSLQGRKA